MPSGYFVTLNAAGQIVTGSAVSGTSTNFTGIKTIGAGTINGGTISGNFVLSSDGNVYFVTTSTLSSSTTVTAGIAASVFDGTFGTNGLCCTNRLSVRVPLSPDGLIPWLQ